MLAPRSLGRACRCRGAPGATRLAAGGVAASNLRLGADVAGVEGTGHGGVLCAFQDGSAVGEDGHFVRGDPETEEEIVLADVIGRGGQPAPQCGQIYGATVLVNLDRIPPAHGDVGLRVAVEVGEFTTDAYRALEVARNAHGLEMAGPYIAREQSPRYARFASDQQFEGFGYLQRGDEVHDGSEDADRVTRF